MAEPHLRRPDLVPAIVLLGIVGVVCIGVWLFPYVQKIIQQQDCIAVGRANCD